MILTAVGVGVLAIGGAICRHLLVHAPSLHMINNTGKDGVSIYIDRQRGRDEPQERAVESWLASSSSSISSGKHKIEAKDASGKVIETIADMEFKSGSNGYLYSPMHGKNVLRRPGRCLRQDGRRRRQGHPARQEPQFLGDARLHRSLVPGHPGQRRNRRGADLGRKRAVRRLPCNAGYDLRA
ncbi:MAG: hypothetical protein U0359_19405 [Byssovorax sp.]